MNNRIEIKRQGYFLTSLMVYLKGDSSTRNIQEIAIQEDPLDFINSDFCSLFL